MRAEVRLAKAEVKDASAKLGNHALRFGVYGVIALLGMIPLIAFMVIGLGKLFGGNYWLSSLLVSLVLVAVGGGLAYRELVAIREEGVDFPETRTTLGKISEITQRRVA